MIAAWQLSLTPETIADALTTERVFLVDFAVLLPLMYFVYLRSRVNLGVAILRSVAIGAAGISFAACLMPEGTAQVLPYLSWLRLTAFPLVIAIELVAFAALMRYLFGSEPQEADLVGHGIPPVVAKLMLMEARFRKAVFRFMTGKKD